ncbi:hypothetical protein D920_00954 [Enterococcus faecalis 13-SD-W-01]|nr:hypothetical protein D920_00954 [Enterococcus faecalis 13-SD-W-01]
MSPDNSIYTQENRFFLSVFLRVFVFQLENEQFFQHLENIERKIC